MKAVRLAIAEVIGGFVVLAVILSIDKSGWSTLIRGFSKFLKKTSQVEG